MAWDLEIVGETVAVRDGEPVPVAEPVSVKRLAQSHHMAARRLARGLSVMQVSAQTGYSPGRLASLKVDPSFKELVVHYERDNADIQGEVEERMRLIAEDARGVLHNRILDDPDSMDPALVLEISKVYYDRAGYAPISRSVNKNLNLTIGARMDALSKRKDR